MVSFRPLTPVDFPMLLDWLHRPHVLEWWDDGDYTLDKIAAHYTRDAKSTKRFVAELAGKSIGYFQYHCFAREHVMTDQFLANGDGLSKGLGTRCLLAFLDMIDKNEQPNIISVDPHPENKRGIRCYEKCGFVHDRTLSNSTVYYMTKANS